MTIRWALQPDEPMPADVLAPLLAMQGATSIHDAHELAVDAVKAGATSEQVRQAINGWIGLQAQQVQTVVSTPTRCRCSHGASVHTGGHGMCHQTPCACDHFADPVGIPARFDERYDPSPEPIDRKTR